MISCQTFFLFIILLLLREHLFRWTIREVHLDRITFIYWKSKLPVIETIELHCVVGTSFKLLDLIHLEIWNIIWYIIDTVTASATDRKPVKPTGNASLTTSFTNLLKNCVGAGVFSLNYRVSAISSTPRDLVYVAGLVFIMAMWAAYNFFIIGETCKISESRTIGEVWSYACNFAYSHFNAFIYYAYMNIYECWVCMYV